MVTAVLKPKEGKFTFDVRNKFLPQRAGGAGTAAQRAVVPHPWRFKARLDGALGSLSWWVAALTTAQGQNWVGCEVPSNPTIL